MKKTGKDFKEAVQALELSEWVLTSCSICKAELQFRFIDGEIYYDSSCDCVAFSTPLQPRTWGDLADFYNDYPHFTEDMNKVFGFDTTER